MSEGKSILTFLFVHASSSSRVIPTVLEEDRTVTTSVIFLID